MDTVQRWTLHPDIERALDALRTKSQPVIYCDPCDGLRVKDHRCVCWQCGAPLKTAPNQDCSICQLIRTYFFPPHEKDSR